MGSRGIVAKMCDQIRRWRTKDNNDMSYKISTRGWNKERNKMSVILTLMRTNASMIEVKVCNSASAMPPRWCQRLCDATTKPLFFLGRAGGRLCQSYRMKATMGLDWWTSRLQQICCRWFSVLGVCCCAHADSVLSVWKQRVDSL